MIFVIVKKLINVSEDLLTSSRATVNETKIFALHQESLQITYMCPSCKSPLVPNEGLHHRMFLWKPLSR